MKHTVFAVSILALAFAGCPAPPQPGPSQLPPPTAPADDGQMGQVVADDVDESPAPVLPDPRVVLEEAAPSDVQVDPATDGGTPSVDVSVTPTPALTSTREVYSVQIFSSSTQSGAERAAAEVRGLVQEEVEVVRDGSLDKVFVGAFATRGPADRLRDHLRANGYSGAWTKQRTVAGTADIPPVVDRTPTQPSTPQATGFVFSVQVFAASNRENANAIASEVRSQTNLPVEVVNLGGMWKVMVGASADRDPIDIERDRLRAAGYPDAWTAQWNRQ